MRIQLQPSKTYGSEDALTVQIKRAGLDHLRYLVSYTPEGRCYPVFVASPDDINSNVVTIARMGFCVVN